MSGTGGAPRLVLILKGVFRSPAQLSLELSSFLLRVVYFFVLRPRPLVLSHVYLGFVVLWGRGWRFSTTCCPVRPQTQTQIQTQPRRKRLDRLVEANLVLRELDGGVYSYHRDAKIQKYGGQWGLPCPKILFCGRILDGVV